MGEKELPWETEKKVEVTPAAKPPEVNTPAPPKKSNFTRSILIALIIVVIILAVVAAYMGYVTVPGITPKKTDDKTVPTPTPVPQPPQEEEELPPPLPDE